MLSVAYTKTFLKKFSKLDPALQGESYEKIEIFKEIHNHQKLKVHKLQKPFITSFSFSVNYKIRIIFCYDENNPNKVYFLTIGNHSQVYKK